MLMARLAVYKADNLEDTAGIFCVLLVRLINYECEERTREQRERGQKDKERRREDRKGRGEGRKKAEHTKQTKTDKNIPSLPVKIYLMDCQIYYGGLIVC